MPVFAVTLQVFVLIIKLACGRGITLIYRGNYQSFGTIILLSFCNLAKTIALEITDGDIVKCFLHEF